MSHTQLIRRRLGLYGQEHGRETTAVNYEGPENVLAQKHTSSTITPAPSPITNPLRLASHGLEASVGQWLKSTVNDLDLSNPVKARGWMQDSAEPATITSASPNAMKREASPMEWAPVVQAVVTAWDGPLKP